MTYPIPLIVVPGAGAVPTNCVRIDSDLIISELGGSVPVADGLWWHGATSGAVGFHRAFDHLDLGGGNTRIRIVMSMVTGNFLAGENLELGPEGGPYSDAGLDANNPVNQTAVPCP